MVVKRDILFAQKYFQGFASAKEQNYYDIINKEYFYISRGEAEHNPQLKQPIAYCAIVNNNRVFAYQRSKKSSEYKETRLQGKWSWGIGGHIDKIDEAAKDPIYTSMMREIDEEIYLPNFKEPKVLGYINDDETDVGQVHFGVLLLINTDVDEIKPKDQEIAWGGFKSIDELSEIVADPQQQVESWSEISLTPLKEILGQF